MNIDLLSRITVIRLAVLTTSAMLASCNSWPPSHPSAIQSPCEQGLNPTDNTRLAGIEQLVNEGKNYAALAQLDALGSSSLQTELVRADALRRIGQETEATTIYMRLMGTCLDGRSQHGLGLIAAKNGQMTESVSYLKRARQVIPTDPRIRNDLGYALLLTGDLDAAQFEFLTVMDLNPGDARAGRNLVLLTFLKGQPEKARILIRQFGIDAATAEQIERQVAQIRSPQSSKELVSPTPHALTASNALQ